MEIWKQVKGFEGLYEVSSIGNIKSIRRGIVLSLRVDKGGYKACTLCNELKKTFKVHRIVYNAFVGDLDNLLVIDHIDGNKINNEYTNLRQIPTRENTTLGKSRKSNYRGVRLFKQNNKWGAEIQIEGIKYFLGLFDNPLSASISYEGTLNDWLNNKVKPYRTKEGYKLCRVCSIEFPVSEFHITLTMKGNKSLMYQCKECESKAKKVRYLKNKVI
jgi:hypothetical protein